MNATLIGCPAVPALLDAYLHRRLPHPQHAMFRDHLDTCQPCWEIWNRYRWDAAAGQRLLAALRDFLGSSYRPYLDSSRALHDEWIAAQPRTAAGIRHFFENSEAYLYNLVIWHASGNRPGYVTAAIPYLTGARIILDFGSGIGQDTIDLRNLGHAVLPCDLPCPSARFMRYRLRQAGHDHRVADPRQLDPPPPADTLWIIDTLDHLPDIPAALGPVLQRVDQVICENLRTARAHGGQGFHQRRTYAEASDLLACFDLREHPTPYELPITVFTRRSAVPSRPTRKRA
ncbi:MAG TPA: zf-HC2 domain-containing protein [Streptosporangiaceae bacterium]|nr:zf-HC2 domain-containing protein [Streptosporangiaceae bacterium]